MMKSRIFYLLPVLIVLSLALISAQTLVAGKIYDTDYNNIIIADANIHVTCNISYLDTISLNDGSYLVAFNDTECIGGDTIAVTASKSGFDTETESEVLVSCTGAGCINFKILNVILNVSATTPATSSGGGGGGSSRYYLCGNGVCDSGETIVTCAKDCTPEFTPLNYETEEENTEEITEISEEEQEIPQTSLFSKITGGTIGVATSTNGIIVIIFVLALCGVFVVKRTIRKRKTA